MSKAVGLAWLRGRTLIFTVVVAIGFEVMVIGLILGHERNARVAERGKLSFLENQDVWWGENDSKPIRLPSTLPASEARLRPDEVVIGVVIGGKSRAYRLEPFSQPTTHLVNDMVGGIPVSVAYCDLTDCVSVYSDEKQPAPLDLEVAGIYNFEMVLRVGESLYFQKSGLPVDPGKPRNTIPFRSLTPVRTSWSEWSRLHPDTDIYVGEERTVGRNLTRQRPIQWEAGADPGRRIAP